MLIRPTPRTRRYEALRAFLYERWSAQDVADRFGYSLATVRTMVRDFRAGHREFFVQAQAGVQDQDSAGQGRRA